LKSKRLNCNDSSFKTLGADCNLSFGKSCKCIHKHELCCGNQGQEKHWFQFEEPINDPTNEPSCEQTRKPTKQMDLDAEFPRNQSLSTSNQDREGVRDNAALSNHSKQRVSFADQPGIENEINNPIAASNSTHNLWHMPPPINLDSSGLHRSSRTEVMK
jgi:hypothetical protein